MGRDFIDEMEWLSREAEKLDHSPGEACGCGFECDCLERDRQAWYVHSENGLSLTKNTSG